MNSITNIYAILLLQLNSGIIKCINDNKAMEEVHGLKVEENGAQLKNGIFYVIPDAVVTICLFGTGFTKSTNITFTTYSNTRNTICEFPVPNNFLIKTKVVNAFVMLITLKVPHPNEDKHLFFLCTKNNTASGIWVHQGSEKWVTLGVSVSIVPLWLKIFILCVAITLSATFSGLTIGIMGLDQTELRILAKIGNEKEKGYVRAILPLREKGTRVLCSLVLANVFVNSVFTVTLDAIASSVVAAAIATVTIAVLAEFVPQAICVRYGLLAAAHTIYLTRFIMIVSFPLSYPLAKCFTMFMGVELGQVYTREKLLELIKLSTEHERIGEEEVNIISGALLLSTKTVGEAMTKLEDVFMLSYDGVLDYDAIAKITITGFSRIPVYDGERNNIVALLFNKDLAFVDPEDCIPVSILTDFYNYPCNFVTEDTTLNVMFKIFKEGVMGHMAFVQSKEIIEGKTKNITLGIITLEDVIEEIIQAEIMDEMDVVLDSYTTHNAIGKTPRGYVMAQRTENTPEAPPQLMFAAFQFLSSTVDAFKPEIMSESILRKLLAQNVVKSIKVKAKADSSSATEECTENILYSKGKPADYFVLLIEGRVRVIIGNNGAAFDRGPFSYFGENALKKVHYRDGARGFAKGHITTIR